jgi:phosphoribosyl 1,2-cyclic phosphodiesterase
MKIHVWGCRGSLPTPGADKMRYGGNTTCIEIRLDDGTLLVVDAGSGIRELAKKMLGDQTITELFFFITHSHWDHLMGFPFFVPAYVGRYTIHVRGGPLAKRSLKKYLSHQMEPPYFPVEFDVMNASFDFTDDDPKKQRMGGATLVPIPLNHPGGGYGFRLTEGDRSFVFLTDNELDTEFRKGCGFDRYVDACRDADVLIHDAQYTDEDYKVKKGWGHSTFESATRLALAADVKRLGLFHHDPDRTDESMDECVESCREQIRAADGGAECFGVSEGMEIFV